MSLQSEKESGIPTLTAEVVRAAFPNGNIYMRLRDEMGLLFKDEQFEQLYPQRGQPAEAPWRLSLITLMQFMEDLTDRQAADAVRARIDWKYALGLALDNKGFHYSVLSEFRTRLVAGKAEAKLFDTILDWSREKGYLKEKGRQRTDSTHIVAAVASIQRIELVGQTLHRILDLLAQVAPDWLRQQARPEWYKRYRQPISDYHLPKMELERRALIETIGKDGAYLLSQIYRGDAPAFLRTIPVVDIFRQIWLQNYYQEGDAISWRQEDNIPPASIRLVSSVDIEVRVCSKREDSWIGYKVHLTETCEASAPELITHVETTLATEQDNLVLNRIQTALKEKHLVPKQHAVDAGYVSAENLVDSQKNFDVDLLGPVRPDSSWQSRDKDAFSATQFQIDWENEKVICPMGMTSSCWFPSKSRFDQPTIEVHFRRKDCKVCSARSRCTRSQSTPRNLCLRPKELYLALQAARKRQTTQAFWDSYAIRSGVEGTIGLAADKLGIRRSRYCGLAKTHLQNILVATAINVKRILNWMAEIPRSLTRVSHFAALAPA